MLYRRFSTSSSRFTANRQILVWPLPPTPRFNPDKLSPKKNALPSFTVLGSALFIYPFRNKPQCDVGTPAAFSAEQISNGVNFLRK